MVQVSDMVQDDVASFSAPQLAAMCGAYVQLCRHSYNDSLLFDAIVEQILRSFKVSINFMHALQASHMSQDSCSIHYIA